MFGIVLVDGIPAAEKDLVGHVWQWPAGRYAEACRVVVTAADGIAGVAKHALRGTETGAFYGKRYHYEGMP